MTAARCVSIQRVDRDIAGHGGRGERPTSSPLPTSPASLTRRPSHSERHLLYVACTRARDHLLVTGVSPVSEFLDDFKGDQDRVAHG
jgi:superfamily I DNA/RNA helicase